MPVWTEVLQTKAKTRGKKIWLQGTRKMGCMAHIEVKTFTLYLEYAISESERKVFLSGNYNASRKKN